MKYTINSHDPTVVEEGWEFLPVEANHACFDIRKDGKLFAVVRNEEDAEKTQKALNNSLPALALRHTCEGFF